MLHVIKTPLEDQSKPLTHVHTMYPDSSHLRSDYKKLLSDTNALVYTCVCVCEQDIGLVTVLHAEMLIVG